MFWGLGGDLFVEEGGVVVEGVWVVWFCYLVVLGVVGWEGVVGWLLLVVGVGVVEVVFIFCCIVVWLFSCFFCE